MVILALEIVTKKPPQTIKGALHHCVTAAPLYQIKHNKLRPLIYQMFPLVWFDPATQAFQVSILPAELDLVACQTDDTKSEQEKCGRDKG